MYACAILSEYMIIQLKHVFELDLGPILLSYEFQNVFVITYSKPHREEKKLRSPEGTDVNEVSVRSTPSPFSKSNIKNHAQSSNDFEVQMIFSIPS